MRPFFEVMLLFSVLSVIDYSAAKFSLAKFRHGLNSSVFGRRPADGDRENHRLEKLKSKRLRRRIHARPLSPRLITTARRPRKQQSVFFRRFFVGFSC